MVGMERKNENSNAAAACQSGGVLSRGRLVTHGFAMFPGKTADRICTAPIHIACKPIHVVHIRTCADVCEKGASTRPHDRRRQSTAPRRSPEKVLPGFTDLGV